MSKCSVCKQEITEDTVFNKQVCYDCGSGLNSFKWEKKLLLKAIKYLESCTEAEDIDLKEFDVK